ncbi:MAG: peptidoglycan DD-metalloendopeptidase family protein [Eubacterium sp.]
MKKKLCGILAGLLCLTLICAPVYAEEASKEALDQKVQNVKDAKYQIDMTKTTIAGIESEIKKSNDEITKIDNQIAAMDTQIVDLDTRMAETKAEIAVAEAKRAKQEKELEERLRVMYMYGNEGYVEMLFSSTDFTDFITRADAMKNIMQADKDCVTALENTKKEIEAKNAILESDKAAIEVAKVAQVDSKTQQENIKGQQGQLLAQNKTLIDGLKATIESETASAQQMAKDLGLSTTVNGIVQTGEYYWPTPNIFSLSSPFGNRMHPIFNEWINHDGIDIAAPSGTPILAAANGTVEIAEYYGGYGNCVVLNMGTDTSGNKISTLYGHMTNYVVSVGETVSQGQVIGYVGSTGNSTGAHLHLGWYRNGVFVDPLNYYPEYMGNISWVN